MQCDFHSILVVCVCDCELVGLGCKIKKNNIMCVQCKTATTHSNQPKKKKTFHPAGSTRPCPSKPPG